MAQTPKVHPSKRKANPMLTKNGKPRLKAMSIKDLHAKLDKLEPGKEKAKIAREIVRRTPIGK